MSNLSKVFIVLNLMLSCVFATFVVGLYAKRGKWKAQYLAEAQSHRETVQVKDTQIAELQEMNDTVTAKARQFEEVTKQQESVIDNLKMLNKEATDRYMFAEVLRQQSEARNEELLNDLRRSHDQVDNMHKIIQKQQKAYEVAKANMRDAINQKIEMENDLNKSRQQLSDVLKDKTRVEKDLQHYTWIIERLHQLNVPVGQLVSDGRPAPPIDGKVLAVQRDVNVVMLSVGEDDAVDEGFQFTVYRGDEYIGKVEVEKVFQDMCSARVLTDFTTKAIAEGDQASTRIQ